MIQRQGILVRRELWEHRSILVTPAVIALLISLMAVTGHVTISAFNQQAVDIAILGASNLGSVQRSTAIGVMMIGISSLFALAMLILIFFYSLDALYAERKDRSILFWRSIPCTDSETVLSKLAVAIVVIPLLTMVAIVVTHLVVLTVTGIWIEIRGANAWHLLWSTAPYVDNWIATLVVLLAVPLWQAPFVGWFLFVSAFARRSPFLMALLPILVLPMLEKTLFGSTLLAQAFFVRTANLPLFRGLQTGDLFFYKGPGTTGAETTGFTLLPLLDLTRFLGNAGLWLGLVVCGLFTAAAIYVRRYRDDS
jgi:ABC-2 type transport system permease protein